MYRITDKSIRMRYQLTPEDWLTIRTALFLAAGNAIQLAAENPDDTSEYLETAARFMMLRRELIFRISAIPARG